MMGNEVNVSRWERWPSAVGGGALLAWTIRRGSYRSPGGIGLLLVAGHQIYRGITGHDRLYDLFGLNTAGGVGPAGSGIKVEHRVTIDKSPDQLFQFWRNFENLPRIMQHLESVRVLDDRRSRWVARAPAGLTVEWDAELVDERANELISWRSLPGADVTSTGSVRFRPAPQGRGTEVEVVLEYTPPAGLLGVGVARLFGEEPDQQVADDLRHFKNLMEAGEIPTTDGQPVGSS
jgi:uncharacterized membrane protein